MMHCSRILLGTLLTLHIQAVVLLSPAKATLTYSVSDSWPNEAHRNAAVSAINSTVERYNDYGFFGNHHIHVYYNAGIPTAQASYLGSIGFGGTFPNERVMMHEAAHFLGLPSPGWGSLMSGGTWSGAHGSALVKQFDGDQAVLNGDSVHFWPYGLNFDSEGSEINRQRQVAMVYAMRADLGIGPSAHPSSATQVVLTASDPFGLSGFNYKQRWSDGYFPHAGAAYFTGDHALRTPASGNSFTFAGDSLTVENTTGENGGLYFKGTGTAGVITFDDLRLDGGWVQHVSGNSNDLFQLDGNLEVVADSVIRAKEGNINVLANVSGNADLTIETTDLPAQDNRYVRFLSSNNTFAGSIHNKSRFELAEDANFRFAIGESGVNNSITGPTALATRLNGSFELDLTGATTNPDDTWALVTAANTTYGSTFEVAGFTGNNGSWSNGSYKFTQATGLLSLVTSWAVDGGGAWSNAGNWTGGVPQAGEDATFGAVLTAPNAPASVELDVPVTLNQLTFDNANRYVIEGNNPLTLSGGAALDARNGSHKIDVLIAGAAGLTKSGTGTIVLAASNQYTGDTNVQSGTLALEGGATIANSANLVVHPGATLDVSGLSGPFHVANGQTLRSHSSSTVAGDVVAANSTVTGSGTFSGHLTMQAGATLQIGGQGLSLLSAPILIDNFNSYDNRAHQNIGSHGNGDVTGGKWAGVHNGTANAQIVNNDDPSDKSIRVHGLTFQSDQWRGAVTNLANNFDIDHSLADGEKATYFFQVRRDGTGEIDGVLGLADGPANIDSSSPWNKFGVTVGLLGNSPQNTDLRAFSEGTGYVDVLNNILNETWYNVWLVVDNENKSYDIYTSTGTDSANPDDPSTYQTGLNFGRDLDVTSLEQFGLAERLANNNPSNAAIRIDNMYRFAGENIGNPLAPGGGFVFSPEILTVDGDVSLEAGSTVAFDIATSGISDLLVVGGNLEVTGTLQVVLDDFAPALSLGDSFQLFDFATASGSFENFVLPGLGTDLAWNVSDLLTTGELSVVVDVDLNKDGIVDGSDFLLIQRNNPSLLTAWEAQYGKQLVVPSLANATTVPEPCSLWMTLIGLLSATLARVRVYVV